jgi:DNA processing protein
VAGQLAAALSARGLVVVSGLARGVDAAAHAGALAGGGGTVAILGCGADVVYPPEHAGLAAAVAGRGALVSEFVPGTLPRPAWFPRRNRLIAALCRAVVVVEAGERSGSLITARCAAEQGRDVLAVPGSILGPHNRGGHALLRDGARLVMHVDDILDELGMSGERSVPGQATGAGGGAVRGATDSDAVLAALHVSEARDLDDVVARSGVPATTALARLLELELAGEVVRSPGGRFARTVPAVLG